MLLQPEPEQRKTAHELKNHDWLRMVNWDYLLGKKNKAPFIPQLNNIVIDSFKEVKEALSVIFMQFFESYSNSGEAATNALINDWDAEF